VSADSVLAALSEQVSGKPPSTHKFVAEYVITPAPDENTTDAALS